MTAGDPEAGDPLQVDFALQPVHGVAHRVLQRPRMMRELGRRLGPDFQVRPRSADGDEPEHDVTDVHPVEAAPASAQFEVTREQRRSPPEREYPQL